MIGYVKQILVGQYEASLAMLNQCIEACPPEQWESIIAQGTFRWVVYHTLFYCDLYLSPNNEAFELRDLHERGGHELGPGATLGLSREDDLTYLAICRQKAHESLAAETEESLAGPSGFDWYQNTRGEMHMINIRHIQHHTGQLAERIRQATGLGVGWVGGSRR